MSMNRRQMLCGAALAGAVAFAPISAEAWIHGGLSTGFPLVAPTGWNGTPGSGVPGTVALAANGTYNGTPYTAGQPLYATRQMALDIGGITANAMPRLHHWQGSKIRGVGPTTLGVFADANGLISHVDAYVEGTLQANLTSVVYTDNNVNGVSRTRPFWGINVDCAAAYAINQTGALRVYFKAYPVDPTMTPRTIGPILVYPRAAAYDWIKTVNSGGGADYSDMQTAMRAMNTAIAGGSAECGKVTITGGSGDYGGGKYEWGTPAAFGFAWSIGHSCVTVLPGVTAYLVRGASFDPNNTGGATWNGNNSQPNAAWRMYSYVNNLEFRGAGLIVDRRNFRSILCDNSGGGAHAAFNLNPIDGSQMITGSFFFNGCGMTNSEGAWPHTYWNGVCAPAPNIEESNGAPVVVFSDSCLMTYITQAPLFMHNILGSGGIFSNVNFAFGAAHTGAYFTFGEYYDNCPLSLEDYYNGGTGSLLGSHDAGTFHYVGSATTGKINWSDTTRKLTFVTTGGGSPYSLDFQTVDPQKDPGDGTTKFATWAQIATYLTANKPGDWVWAPTSDPFCPYWLFQSYQANNGLWPLDAKTSAVHMLNGAGIHAEWFMYTGGYYENVVLWNCTARNSGWGTSAINLSAVGDNFRDVSIKNDTYDPGTSTFNIGNGFNPTGKHVNIENCTVYDEMLINSGGVGIYDAYSTVTQCVSASMSLAQGSYGTGTSITPTNCITAGSPPAGNGNVNLNPGGGSGYKLDYPTEWSPLFVNNALGNLTPAPGQALATNLFTTVNPRDAQMAARAASDAAGAWKLGGTAPTWPF